MARPKEFDRDEALDRAMDLFWLKGYEAASLQDLLEHMDIGRQSLYDTFGGKHELFLAALDRYREVRVDRWLARLVRPEASLDVVRKFCEAVLESCAADRRACFLTNSMVELAAQDGQVSKKVRAYLIRMEAGFLNAIRNAIEKGEIRRGKDPRALARHLTNSILGITAFAKGGASRKALNDSLEVALSVLE